MLNVIESQQPPHGPVQMGSFVPQTIDEWMMLCGKIANSSLCPTSFRSKPDDVFIACQMGADLGLKPMQALQNIAVINGRPCIWGDAALAVCRSNREFENIEEFMEGDTAICIVYRKANSPARREFSKEDAIVAGLWEKSGPWKNYPKRMLQMRARGFALRDTFPDSLRGMSIREEVEDYAKNDDGVFVPVERPFRQSQNVLSIACAVNEYAELSKMIKEASNLDDLKDLLKGVQFFKGETTKRDMLRTQYKDKFAELKKLQEQPQSINSQYEEVQNANA